VNGYQICMLALLVGGLGPAVAVGARGRPTNRLIGLELGSAVLVVLLLLVSVATARSYDLILPLVLAPLSFAGTLVYTRLLAPEEARRDGGPDRR
jgi:multisubunit Na+/H+ antiporter MnhF subunit